MSRRGGATRGPVAWLGLASLLTVLFEAEGDSWSFRANGLNDSWGLAITYLGTVRFNGSETLERAGSLARSTTDCRIVSKIYDG